MTNTAILAASALLLFAYAVEHFGRHFRLPPVVLLIVTGLVARQILDALGLRFHWVDPIVPIIGTLGLILIVLEGSLDLKVSRERQGLIVTALASSLRVSSLTLGAFALLFSYVIGFAIPTAMLAAIPFAVISSAVAIPSAAGLPERPREFVVYESSLSDILGVLVFYAWLAARDRSKDSRSTWSAAARSPSSSRWWPRWRSGISSTRSSAHVRFLPLLAGLVFLYAIGKELHLSPLIVVLVCGLIINNPHLVTWHAKLRALQTDGYAQTLHEFKGLVAELTFAIKSFFFLLLGYWTDVQQMLSVEALADRRRRHRDRPCVALGHPETPAPGGRRATGVDRAARPRHGAAVPERARHRQARSVSVRRGDARRARDVRAHRAGASGRRRMRPLPPPRARLPPRRPDVSSVRSMAAMRVCLDHRGAFAVHGGAMATCSIRPASRDDAAYLAALDELEDLMLADPGTPGAVASTSSSVLIEEYEACATATISRACRRATGRRTP